MKCLMVAAVLIVATIVVSTTLILTRKTKTTTEVSRTGIFNFGAESYQDYYSAIRVMTYNIRFDTTGDGINEWNLRKDRVAGLIRYHAADLFGVQEALPNQVADLKAALPTFNWYGAGRDDGKNKGELSAIFYRSNRFELLDKDTFWLSETPEIPGSKGWDAENPRVCSWVKLRDRYTSQKLYHFNTHFDHVGETARRESARLIMARIQSITNFTVPVILTGDFNAGPDSDAYRITTTNSSMDDAKVLSETPSYGPNSTWSTFFVGQGFGDRIDYIFITSQNFKVLHHATLTDSNNQYYPSDHLPVLAELAIKNSKILN